MISDLFIGKTSEEKVGIKATQIALLDHVGTFENKEYQVEIISLDKIDKGVEILARVWKDGKQIGFTNGVEIERFRIINPPILVDDPLGDIVRTTDGKNRTLLEDPIRAIQEVLADTISKIYQSSDFTPGKVGSTDYTIFATVDGGVRRLVANPGEVWGTIRGGAGTDAYSAGPDSVFRILDATTSNQFRIIARYIAIFDTSPIPDTDTITAATVTVTGNGSKSDPDSNTPNLDIYVATPASDLAIVAGDYGQIGTTSQTGSPVTYANLPSVDGNTATWNYSIFTNISKTGVTRVGWQNANYDVANVSPTWSSGGDSALGIYYVDATGTTKDPVMVITSATPSQDEGSLNSKNQLAPRLRRVQKNPTFYLNERKSNEFITMDDSTEGAILARNATAPNVFFRKNPRFYLSERKSNEPVTMDDASEGTLARNTSTPNIFHKKPKVIGYE